MVAEYDIHKSTHQCCVTGKTLEEGEAYYSVLVEAGVELVRQDYSIEAWGEEPAGAIAVWKTRVPVKGEPKKLVIDVEMMLDFIKRLENADEPHKINMRYLLGLLLMRKRVLKFDEVEREGDNDYLILTHRREDVTYRILDPHLSEQELEDLQAQMETVIGMEM